MPTFKTVSLALLALLGSSTPVTQAAVTVLSTFQTSKGDVVTMKLAKPEDFPDRKNISELLIIPPSQINESDPYSADQLFEHLDGVGCYIPQIAADVEDCNNLCNFFNENPLRLATIPGQADAYWELGTCTFAVVNRTQCTILVLYGFFTQYCNDVLGECIINGYDGVYDLESQGMAAALSGTEAAPAYSPLAC